MSKKYSLEIKTFTVKQLTKRTPLSAREIGEMIFNINPTVLNNTSLVKSFKNFISDGYTNLKDTDNYIINESQNKKFRLELVAENLEYNSFIGVVTGGIVGERGRFNKKRSGVYTTENMDIDDFTDIPFLFYVHLSIDSPVGVIMIYRTSTRSLNKEIKALFSQCFRESGYSITYRPFLSESQIKRLKDFSTVEKIVISQNVRGASMNDQYSFFDQERQYTVKIEISQINEPSSSFFPKIMNRKNRFEKESVKSIFPNFRDLGINNEEASIKTFVKEEGGSYANPKLEEYDTYFEKMIPKLFLNENSSVEYGINNTEFTYINLLTELNTILVNEVLPTLNQEGND
jgi:hypothetical protein